MWETHTLTYKRGYSGKENVKWLDKEGRLWSTVELSTKSGVPSDSDNSSCSGPNFWPLQTPLTDLCPGSPLGFFSLDILFFLWLFPKIFNLFWNLFSLAPTILCLSMLVKSGYVRKAHCLQSSVEETQLLSLLYRYQNPVLTFFWLLIPFSNHLLDIFMTKHW